MGSSATPTGSATAEAVDPFSTSPYSLHSAVHGRRSEYVRLHRMRIKIGTWNVAACPGTDKDLARWFIDEEGLDPALGSSKPPDNGTGQWEGSQDGFHDIGEPIELSKKGRIGLYVLGLQEVNVLTAPSQYMSWIYTADDTTMTKWKAAIEAALPTDYQLVAAEQLAGLLLLAYASPEIAPTISNVSTSAVGTGALGYLGNKGAVCTRIVVGEATQLLFVNSHLASGVEDYYLDRRVSQAQQIITQARFEPITISGVSEEEKGKIGDEDFAFWFGDLNFRLDRLPGDDIRRLLLLHTRGEYDLSKRELRRESSLEGEPIVVDRLSDSSDEVGDRDPGDQPQEATETNAAASKGSDDDSINLPDPEEFPEDPHGDPASLQATLDSLLPHDQLKRLIKQRKVFHEGWREGTITFLPTYKYDVGTVTLFDSSEKRRPPSWCDRVLYRTHEDMQRYEKKVKEEEDTRKKDEEMKARGMEEGVDDDVLFSYDPENDGEEQPTSKSLEYDEYDEAEDGGGDENPSQPGHDRLRLELYTSHQRITSSDHKPVTTIFTLDYDAVVPELKGKVHAEVARELDRAENEGRPVITVVVDRHDPRDHPRLDDSDSPTHIDLGEIRFLDKKTATLTLANTGGVPATLSFLENQATNDTECDNPAQTTWLMTSFVHPEAADDDTEPVDVGREVTLQPGETLNAVLDASVTEVAHAQMLNAGQSTLEEVLVLRVTNGRDHFVPVRASWSPTCIGRSVEELIRVPDSGIRAFAHSLSKQKGSTGPIPHDLPAHRPAPRELFQLIEAIETVTQRVVADAQMLEDCTIPSDPGWPFDEAACKSTDVDTRTNHILSLLSALDQNTPLPSAFPPETPSLHRLEALSQTLLLFLRGLTDGIVPAALWARIEDAAPSIPSLTNPATTAGTDDATLNTDRSTLLDILQSAPNHNICFVFLTTTLARVVSELAPLSRVDLEVIRNDPAASPSSAGPAVRGAGMGIGGVLGGVGRKSLSLVRRGTIGGGGPVGEALARLERRRVRERRVAEVFGAVVCRGLGEEGAKERRVGEARRRAVMELFLRRRGD